MDIGNPEQQQNQRIPDNIYEKILQHILNDSSITVNEIKNLRQINEKSFKTLSDKFYDMAGLKIIFDTSAEKSKNILQIPNRNHGNENTQSTTPINKIVIPFKKLFKKKADYKLTLPPPKMTKTMEIINNSWTPNEELKIYFLLKYAPTITTLEVQLSQLDYLYENGLCVVYNGFNSLKHIIISEDLLKIFDLEAINSQLTVLIFALNLLQGHKVETLTFRNFSLFLDEYFLDLLQFFPNLRKLSYKFTPLGTSDSDLWIDPAAIEQFSPPDDNKVSTTCSIVIDCEYLEKIHFILFEPENESHKNLLKNFIEILTNEFEYDGDISFWLNEENDQEFEYFADCFTNNSWEIGPRIENSVQIKKLIDYNPNDIRIQDE